MATNLFQNYGGLQGSGALLQGSGASLQGSSPNIQNNPAPAPITTYGNTAATSPAKQKYINDLSSKYGLSGGTVFDKATNTALDLNAFKAATGINNPDWASLKFDTGYTPVGVGTSIPAAPSVPAPKSLAEVNASIPVAPESDPMAAYKTAYAKYIDSLAPSADVMAAKKAYADYVTNAKLGINNIEGQGRGIPLSLVRGTQDKLRTQAEIEAARLQGDIGLATETQSQQQAQAKAIADFEGATYKNKADQEAAAQKFAFDNNIKTPFYTVGGTTYRTSDGHAFSSQGEAFGAGVARDYSNAPKISAPQKPIQLGEGDVLIDPITGQPIYKNPKTYDPLRQGAGTGLGGLTNQQIDNISPVTSQFKAEPIVQNFNTIAEGYNFAKSLSSNTKNPADDQALIYAFAKAMDPGSVVREGEYATVQKYAQSLVSSYGKSVSQAISGTGFLSQQARDSIKKTIESRYNTSKQNYDNVYNEYLKRISTVGGLSPDQASQFLTNYAGGYNSSGGSESDPLGLGFSSVGNTSASIKLGSPLAIANNNPGNLRFVGQAGAVQGKGGFAKFATPQAGVAALNNQISLDASRGHTLASFINKYAPSSENNTSLYLQQAIKSLGVSPNTKLSSINRTKLLAFIARKESSSTIA